MTRLPLEGIRIIDLTQVWAGPYGVRLLADMGAEVIKIEAWQRFDWNRQARYALPLHRDGGTPPFHSTGQHNLWSRNKYGITLDLSRPPGKEIFKRLVKIGDVVWDNFSARVMRNLGLDYPVLKEVNPRIIMISMPGYGMSGPERDRLAYGTTVSAMAGLLAITGYPDGEPYRSAFNYADPCGSLNAALAVLMALHYRAETGQGQFIELAQCEGVSCMLGEAFMDYTMNGRVQKRMGNRDRWLIQGAYPCKGDDKWIAISLADDQDWGKLVEVMGRPAWALEECFTNHLLRRQHQDELDKLIGQWTSQFDQLELMDRLQEAGIAAGALLNAKGVMEDSHLKERGFFQTVKNAEDEVYRDCGVVWRLSDTPGAVRMPSPGLGEHNRYVYGQLLGMSEEEMAALAAEKII